MAHWAIIEWIRPRPELRAWAGTKSINTTWVRFKGRAKRSTTHTNYRIKL